MTEEKKLYVLKTSTGSEIPLELESISKNGRVVLKKVNEVDSTESDSDSTCSDSDYEEEMLQKQEEIRMYQAELDMQLVALFILAVIFGVVAYLFFPLEQMWKELNEQ